GAQVRNAAHPYLTPQHLIPGAALIVGGTLAAAIGGVLNITVELRWFIPGRQPDARQRRLAMRLISRQSAVVGAIWAVSGAVSILLNLDRGARVVVPTLLAVVFGGSAAAAIALVL